ncbi:hypothetical protein F6I25_00840 [Lactobacillus jensenii]|jgi:hypothetical protein|uniref:CHD-like protein n=1 Tax=Siphoviridae sp. ctX581 TaxID=2826365 RepID=A0A8S5MEH7_9CAUD|nr:hypothetical protein HMPREF0974_00277 [Lactobacillus jensenii 115-3-CHN]KAA9369842.1 hypothetical protein F6I25_00840 [Lactobacillus jensenii]NKC42666.1 hypothetical protein [Lactobacillus mulieris]DAD80347.1 MAG TPA: CHD-like protein [Siphoviridae sp. ctX581]DAX31948.1 MAG TPA: CHD-like protein [Caudoviricetes sp.]
MAKVKEGKHLRDIITLLQVLTPLLLGLGTFYLNNKTSDRKFIDKELERADKEINRKDREITKLKKEIEELKNERTKIDS